MPAHAILTAEQHRELRIRTDRGAALGDGVMSCVTMPTEFRRVQDAFPILFRINAERDDFTPVALFGFETGENLFLVDGRWDAGYRPLALEIQPFLIGRAADPAEPKQVHVDLASPRIGGGEGMRVFDENGQPTPYLDDIAEKLGAIDEGLEATRGFIDALRRYDLLEPLIFDVTLADGSTNRLVGFHAIDEDRLRALSGTALGDLHEHGHLMPIFMAIASLGRFHALIERKNRQLDHG